MEKSRVAPPEVEDPAAWPSARFDSVRNSRALGFFRVRLSLDQMAPRELAGHRSELAYKVGCESRFGRCKLRNTTRDCTSLMLK